jgi:hypothetical protein
MIYQTNYSSYFEAVAHHMFWEQRVERRREFVEGSEQIPKNDGATEWFMVQEEVLKAGMATIAETMRLIYEDPCK